MAVSEAMLNSEHHTADVAFWPIAAIKKELNRADS